jgi:TP901 family phage tail tape measure protein
MADIQSNIKVNVDTSDAMASIKALQNQISAFQTQMARSSSAQAAAAKNLQRTLLDNVNASGKFAASLTTIKTTTESFTSSLEKNKLSMREYFRYAGGASKSFGKLFKSEFDTINKVARERVKDLQTQYIQLGRDANGAMQAIKVRPLVLDMENLATKTAMAAQKQALLNQLLKQGSTNLLNFGKNTQWAGRQLMVGFTIPLGILGSTAAKTFMEMEAQAIKFKRVYGDIFTTSQETNKALKDIRDLATEFTKYGVAASKTMELAASAAATGKTGAALLSQVNQANRLAVLGNVEQQQALQTTMSLTDAFGVKAQDLGKKINFLNAVENQTVTSIEDLTEAIPKAGPVIKQLGGNVEDLTFFLTAMREGGINASEGANALKSGLASMINPTEKASNFLAGFGINLKQIVEANKGDVRGTVIEFAKALDTLDPLNRAQAIEQLFGKFQFSRLSTLFKNVIGEGTQASRVLEMAASSSTDLAKLANSELKKLSESPMYKFQKAIEDIKVQLAPVGEEFLKAITPIVQFGSDILKSFNNLDSGIKQFIVNATGLIGGIGPIFLMTFGLIANGAANIIKLFALMKNGFNKLGGSSRDLASQTQYMTNEQVEAAAIASSLDQAHNKLRQTFTLEAGALNQLTAAYQRNIAASGMRPATPVKRFAEGGMIMGPGSGTSDSIPAMVSNGEFITSAKRTKQYLPLLQNIAAGTVPGYASPDGGSIVGGPDVKSYTNAVGLFTATENYDLKAGKADAGSLGKNILARGGKVLSPILHEAATQMLIESGQRVSQANIRREIERNPELVAFVEKTSKTLGESISRIPGKIGDAAVGAEFKKAVAANSDMLTPQQLSAVQRVQSQLTTVEDPTKLRIRKSGRVDSIGRMGIFKRLASYKNKKRGYLQTGENLSGMLPPEEELVLAHLTDPKSVPMSEYAKSGNLTKSAQAMVQRGQQGVTQITKEGEIGKAVTVPTQQLRAKGMSFAERVKKAWNDAVANGFDRATKRNSPPQEAIDAGEDYGRALNSGAKSQVDDAKAAGQTLANAVVGGASGKARRAQDPGGSTAPMIITPGGTQSGGRRRVQTPGDLEARQAAEAAAMRANGNALSRKTKNQMRLARAKVRYNQVKTGKINIGGKISGGGFGVAGAAAMASMAAPPEMQGMLNTVSMVSSIVGMFGGVLGKVVPLLLRFAGPIGIAITAISLLGAVAKAAADEEKKRVEARVAVGRSQLASQGQKSAASQFFGRDITPTSSIRETSLGGGFGAQNSGTVAALAKDPEFKKQNKQLASRLKNMNPVDAQMTLQNLGMQLRAQGYSNEEVQQQLQAISMMAGRATSVGSQFGIGTKVGQKAFGVSVGQVGAAARGIGSIKTTDLIGLNGGSGMVKYGTDTSPTTEAGKKNLETAAGGSLAALQALKDQYHAGLISANQYRRGVAQLSKQFNGLQKEAKQLVVAKMLKEIGDANLTKVVSNMRDINEQFKLLVMAQNNMIDNQTQALLNNGTFTEQAIAIAKIMNLYKTTDFGKLTDTSGGDKKTALEARLEATQKKIDLLQIALDIIAYKEDKINKTYDKRVEALEKVKQANEEITRQQQLQLNLADAVSRGDVAAAANAAAESRSYASNLGFDRQGAAIEAQRQRDLSAITAGGKNRSQIEAQIALLQYKDNLYQFGNTKFKFSKGGMVPSYFAAGGFANGTDTVPAMLTPGEFVIRKSAVDRIGVDTLSKINGYANGGTVKDTGMLGSSVYNYSISVNVSSASDANEIANRVMDSIRRVESQNIRSNRF